MISEGGGFTAESDEEETGGHNMEQIPPAAIFYALVSISSSEGTVALRRQGNRRVSTEEPEKNP